MNQTNVKVDPNDKWMKLDRFVLKKTIFGTVWGDQFLYISLKFDYKVNSWLLQYFFLYFRYPILIAPPSFIPSSLSIFTLHMQARLVDLDTCPISPFPKSLGCSCKAEGYYSDITSTLIRPEN